MSNFDVTAFLGVFLDEVEEQLQILDIEVLQLEKNPGNEQTIQNIFRAAHTLKGSSAAMGFDNMKNVTHEIENVFDQIRHQQLSVSPEIIEVIFESIDTIKQLKEAVQNNREQDIDIRYIVQKIKRFVNEEPIAQSPVPIVKQLQVDELQQNVIRQAYGLGQQVYAIQIELEDNCLMKSVRAVIVHNRLLDVGEIIATNPSVNEMEDDAIFDGNMQFIVTTKQPIEDIKIAIQTISEIKSVFAQPVVLEQEMPAASEQVDELQTEKVKVASTVRVDVEKLEHLMNLVGELVIDQTRLVDVKGRFAEKQIRNEEEFEILDEVTNHLNRVVTELQEGMMKTRMLPIEQLFNRFPRMVRDTATKAGKQINFVMQGKETELDRTLIEEISDPIIHLLRNAVDHGIESAEERVKAGKTAAGNVTLKASHEENHIVITITDDGKGINVHKVKQASIEKGVITAEAAEKLSEKDAMFLIFKSGISTAQQVTDISGRGVGMDIVRAHIEKLNGVIDIESQVGKGTKFTVKLPLTLAIIRSLLVKFGYKTFAIPLVNVLEIIRLNKDEIQLVNEQEVGMVRGRVLPLVRMKDVLNIQDEQQITKSREFVVVVGIADKQIGIIADKTLGNQEIVIKSLGQYIGSPEYISGATIMGDGNVALILDVSKVVKANGAKSVEMEQEQQFALTTEEEQLVTFRLLHEEYSVDIKKVKDIIAVPNITKVVETTENLLGIVNLRGTMLPVYDLRRIFNLPEQVNTKKSRILIVENGNQDIGFLVDEVTQVIKSSQITIGQISDETFNKNNSIQGVINIDERIVFVLSFENILASLHLI